jgi:hypothetical protein
LPEFVSEGCDVIVSERLDAMSDRIFPSMRMVVSAVLKGLP